MDELYFACQGCQKHMTINETVFENFRRYHADSQISLCCGSCESWTIVQANPAAMAEALLQPFQRGDA